MPDELFWQNKEKENIAGEIWTDAYGFEGLYEVSNKGRVRSIDRLIKGRYGNLRKWKGKVLSQGKVYHGSKKFSLFVHLANGDGTYSIKTVASLILNSFKKPDKFNDKIHHINGISNDNRLKNLTFEDLSTKRKIEFDLKLRDGKKQTEHFNGAQIKNLTPLSGEELKRLRGLKKNRSFEQRNKKPITVYLRKKRFIGSYSCVKNASEQLGIKEYTIRNALKRNKKGIIQAEIQAKYGILNLEEFSQK